MLNNKITCPYCNKEFAPDDAMKHKIEEQVSASLEEKHKKEIEQVRTDTENKIKEKYESEGGKELEELKKIISEKDSKLDEFREKEIDLREKTRKLEEREKDLELESKRKIDEERKVIEESTTKRVAEDYHDQLALKDKRMSDMAKQIEDLKRISQQGSMQSQGEVGEIELEKLLKKLFVFDEITEVKKGEQGGDVRQLVKSQKGNICGMIVWERKKTKVWQEDWVRKIKIDLQRDGALVGVIVTDVLPKEFKKDIGEKNGVWITKPEFVEPLATLLRNNLYDVAKEKAIKLNKQSKAEELYDFVTDSSFTQRVQTMVDIYNEMKTQVSKERSAFEKIWKQREMQIDGLLKGVSGIYGGMQLIAGNALPQVKSLELDSGLE